MYPTKVIYASTKHLAIAVYCLVILSVGRSVGRICQPLRESKGQACLRYPHGGFRTLRGKHGAGDEGVRMNGESMHDSEA